MKNNIETLDEAIAAGLKVTAVYNPNGEVVKVLYDVSIGEIEYQDGTFDKVSVNDLSYYSWNI